MGNAKLFGLRSGLLVSNLHYQLGRTALWTCLAGEIFAGWPMLQQEVRAQETPPPPVVFILNGPAAEARLTNATVEFSGSVSNHAALVEVQWQVINSGNDTNWYGATGTTNWLASPVLVFGSNVFRVRARDALNTVSAEEQRVVVLLAPLVIAVNGCGSVEPDSPGTVFKEVGRTYTLQAVPCAGSTFRSWTGSDATSPELTYVMTAGLSLQANFELFPYTPLKATYNGLFYDSNHLAEASSGGFKLNTTDTGKFSGSARIGKLNYRFTGQFDEWGHAEVEAKAGRAMVRVVMQMATASNAEWLAGTVLPLDGEWSAQLLAQRSASHSSRGSVAPDEGRYTLVLPGAKGSNHLPQGDGFGSVIVTRKGRVRLTGKLADGTAYSQSVQVSTNRQWPVYVSAYRGKGCLVGWLAFNSDSAEEITGDIGWIRPALPKSPYYPAGFSFVTPAIGSRYVRPERGDRVLDLEIGSMVLSGGNLAQDWVIRVNLSDKNRVTTLGGGKIQLRFSLATGLFQAKCTAGVAKPIVVRGAVLQNQSIARGWFLGATQSGAALLYETASFRGAYNGLFANYAQPSMHSSGAIQFKVSESGSASGYLWAGNKKSSIRGRFDVHGRGTLTNQASRTNISLNLQMSDATNGSDWITGTAFGPGWRSETMAGRRLSTNSASQAGDYTFTIQGNPAAINAPGGDGYGKLTVKKNAAISLSGTLADSAPIKPTSSQSPSMALVADNLCPLYVSLYSGKGFLMGWVSFAPSAASDFSGNVAWFKPASLTREKYYTNGFTTISPIEGSRLLTGAPLLTFSRGALVLEGGSPATGLTNYFDLQPNGSVSDPGTNNFQLRLSARSGSFTGSIKNPANGKTIGVQGGILQKQNSASGFFLTNGVSGRVLLLAAPAAPATNNSPTLP